MSRFIISMGCILVCFLGLAVYIYNKKVKKVYAYRCALIVPAEHPAMDEICAGFIQTIDAQNLSTEYVLYNGQGNKTLLNSQIEKAVQSNFDLVFTVGTTATQLTHELIKKRNNTKIAHIFTAVDDPMEKGLVDSLEHPAGQTTGVTSNAEEFLSDQIATLKAIKPTVKHIMLVYDPAHPGNAKDKEALAKICGKQQIQFSDLAIMQTNELMQKVSTIIDTVDTILVLKDHLIVTGIDVLIKLCSLHNVTLYCSDLNSGQKGAALAFGVYEYDYGKHAGIMAIDILKHKKNPAFIPVYKMSDHHLLINRKTSAAQGIILTDEQLDMYKQKGAIVYE